MPLKRCLQCGGIFKPVKKRHYFCCTECKRKYYYINVENSTEFPVFSCPHCKFSIKLDFYPLKELEKWAKFTCPECKNKPSDLD